MVKVAELEDVIGPLLTEVANTSFALGILFKELADIYETIGRMGKCVPAYRIVFPIVEYVNVAFLRCSFELIIFIDEIFYSTVPCTNLLHYSLLNILVLIGLWRLS